MQEANKTSFIAASTQVHAGVLLGIVPADAGSTKQALPRPQIISATLEASVASPVTQTKLKTVALTAAQEKLLLEHLPTVRHVARGMLAKLPQYIELEELVGAGTLGLLDAVRKFDGGKNVQFRSYAQFRIRGAILDSLRSVDWSPRELRRKGRAMQESIRTLELRLSRAPLEAEIAADMGLSLQHLQQLAEQLKGLNVTSLHAERGDESGEEELAFLPAKESENPLLQYLAGETSERLMAALDRLAERDRLVMTLYYFEEMTMREIAMVLGVVESRISQIHHLAVKRLRMLLSGLRNDAQQPVHAALRARRAS